MKEVLSAVALLLTFAAFLPYIRTILHGQTRPHVFTWIIWGAGTFVVFLAQLSDGGGVGAWPIGISGLLTIIVAFLAMTRSADTSFHRMDWGFLTLALTALPLWWLTNTPLYTVLILTGVDLLGFGPTVRKAYSQPYEESWTFYAIGAIRNGFVILALEHYSWTTMLFPAAVGLACLLFIGMLLIRRRSVPLPARGGN
ncbi:hypothetical protein [Hyphomonas pacifica]|uniref:Uncharacterized protein n=1 Tax=Hyphomonas pacifica TaxID=1280941 RepID=A0A062TUN2_9PROT|nr:hypothetical protein [Hyphomonas pacifica]KCZ46161.1 hypothetical protein HY2_05630 [Hyphomonas pacifica]RAN31562.1 hypothetical protein HY11_07290 [Hyphomonas pacifica]RAN35763.1 hypothetical protein HY3_06605 [Hyphomonas pacifica]